MKIYIYIIIIIYDIYKKLNLTLNNEISLSNNNTFVGMVIANYNVTKKLKI